ncbi:magnesium transporter MgtE N-terminal domain-containing protein [Actinoplanes sp. RD1]|uniref:magnesium transporter MgtE N-terminal domain-containing protein n=1 Tax=Actinoplanes sp. RD1 TaxID=3064538 RepID=UPI0027419AA5|nr:hypothetical protein [Actinoplanes sp. RD1]
MLGSMPTDHVVTMLRAAPPHRAVNALLAMPRDRIERLLGAMDGRLIARLLTAADPARRAALAGHLGDARLGGELALLPPAEAAAVLAVLPDQRAVPLLGRLGADQLGEVLEAMPAAARERLEAALDPQRGPELRRVAYEKRVIETLRRTGAGLQWVPGEAGSHLLTRALHRLFGVSICHVEVPVLPVMALDAARQAFAGHGVRGLLVVTNAGAGGHTVAAGGAPALVVTWNPGDNDGVLGRSLVRLAG